MTDMVRLPHILKLAVAAVTLAILGTVAFAQERLDGLMQELRQADAAEAKRISGEVELLWRQSGSASADLLLKRGLDALERGEVEAAVDHLSALTDHAPEFARGWYERARAYFAMELYGPSVADLERALALNPNDYNAIYALGALFEQFRDPERAYQAYQRAKAIHPHHEQVSSALERLKPLVEGKEL
jgi:tetratricopeptide (TPR) repeat protein